MFKLVKTLAMVAGIVSPDDPHFKIRFGNAEEVALSICRNTYNPYLRDSRGNNGFHAAAFLPETMEVLLQSRYVNSWEKGLLVENKQGVSPVDIAIQPVLDIINKRIGFINPNLEISGKVSSDKVKEQLKMLQKPYSSEELFVTEKMMAKKRRDVRAFNNPDQG